MLRVDNEEKAHDKSVAVPVFGSRLDTQWNRLIAVVRRIGPNAGTGINQERIRSTGVGGIGIEGGGPSAFDGSAQPGAMSGVNAWKLLSDAGSAVLTFSVKPGIFGSVMDQQFGTAHLTDFA